MSGWMVGILGLPQSTEIVKPLLSGKAMDE